MVDKTKLGRKKPNPDRTVSTPMSFEEYVLSLKSNADDAYKQTVANAEIERQRANVDAQNAYHHAMPTYGTTAASLSALGLTGSGYSDYLDSKAYGQMRADMNAANRTKQLAVNDAATVKNTAYANADATYMGYLEQKEANRKNVLNSMYENLDSLTDADIDAIAKINGIDASDVEYIKSQKTNKVKSEAGTVTFDDTSESDAKIALDEIGKTLGTDSEEYKVLEEKYEATYNPKTSAGVKFSGNMFSRIRADVKGDNFEVKDSDGKVYNVQNGGKVGETDADSAVLGFISSGKVKDNEVFEYKGGLYMRVGTDIIRIAARPTIYQRQYQELLDYINSK